MSMKLLTPETRELMLKVCDGHPEVPKLLFFFLKMRRRDDMLRWCLANKMKGNEFMLFFKNECDSSPLEMMKTIKNRVERLDKIAPVLVGRDYIA